MITIYVGSALERLRQLPDDSVHCVVTSPPYWGLRDYGVDGQMGLEATPAEFIANMVGVFEEVRRVLRSDGTCWVNMGDSYAGSWGAQSRGNTTGELKSTLTGTSPLSARQIKAAQHHISGTGSSKRTPGLKPKDLCMMPHRLAIALQDAGWWVRQDIVWNKPNPMPESIRDRCTKAHEYIFLLSKSERYYYDADAIREPVAQDPDHPRNRWDTKTYEVPGQKPQKRASRNNGVGLGHGTDKDSRHRERVTASRNGVSALGYDDKKWEQRHDGFSHPPMTMVNREYNPAGRNKRSVWTIATSPFPEAHFATFPPELPETCIKAGCPAGGTVLDPFFGAGTTGLVADRLQRDCIGIELNPAYVEMAAQRIRRESTLFAQVNVIQEEPPCQPSKTAA